MPGIGLFARGAGKTDRAAIGGGRRLAIDWQRRRKHAGWREIEDPVAVYVCWRNAERAEYGVVKGLGLFQIIGADHDV